MEPEKKKLNLKIIIPIVVVIIVAILGVVVITGNSSNYLTSTEWKSLNGTQVLKFNKDNTGTSNGSSFNWEENDGIITITYKAGTVVHLKYVEENGVEKIYNLNDTNVRTDIYTCINSNEFDTSKNKIINQVQELDVFTIYHSTNTAQIEQQYNGKYYRYTAEVAGISNSYCNMVNLSRANDYIKVYLPTEELATLKAGDKITIIGCFDSFNFDLMDAFLVEKLRTVDSEKCAIIMKEKNRTKCYHTFSSCYSNDFF